MLTAFELDHFREKGYVTKQRFIGKDLITKFINRYWQFAPTSFVRDDPTSWTVPLSYARYESDGNRVVYKDYRYNLSVDENAPEVKCCVKSVIPLATDIIGKDRFKNVRQRGILSVLPGAPGRTFHIDGPRSSHFVGITILLDDVDVDMGGFTFIPESHHITSKIFSHLTEKEYYDLSVNGFELCSENPVQFTGSAGDLVVWDQYLLHRFVKNDSDRIRFAYFLDCQFRESEDAD